MVARERAAVSLLPRQLWLQRRADARAHARAVPSLSASDDEFYLQDRDTFSRFCYHLHETVNTMLDKPTPMSLSRCASGTRACARGA